MPTADPTPDAPGLPGAPGLPDATGALGAVIFDFDGTLVDTEWPIFERARAAAARLGAVLTPELWSRHAVGVSHDEDWWSQLGPALGLSIDQAAFDAEVARVTDVPTAFDSAPLTPGAADLVAGLADAGVALGVASGSTSVWVEHHLARFSLAERFGAVAGRDHPDVRGGKPLPDTYLVAARTLGVGPRRCVAVEDTARGVAAARAAGVAAVVAVPSRLTVHHDLSEADLEVASLTELDPARLAALASDAATAGP